MRILVLTNRVPYPLHDGGNIASMQMIDSMRRCGYEVKLLSLNTRKHHVDLSKLPESYNSIHPEVTDINTDIDLKGVLTHLFKGKSYNASRFVSNEFKQLLQQTLLNGNFDLVHFEGIYMASYLETVRAHTNAKCVLRPHNIEYEIWENAAEDSGKFKGLYLKILAKQLKRFEIGYWPLFDGIIPITTSDEFTIRDQLKPISHILTLPTAMDIQRIEVQVEKSNNLSVFHLGSMNWIPNQQAMQWFMENAWPTVAASTKATFYMAGRDMPEAFFGYENENVKVIGEVADAGLFISDKQIMVVPLFAGSGVRIKILEGMAAGKTIITTSLGVQGIDVFDKQEVLIANNPKSFAEAVIWCIKNEKKCKEIGLRARKFMEENYSLSQFEAQLKLFLQQVCSNTN